MSYSSVSNNLKNVSRWESPMGFVNVTNMASVLALNATGSSKIPKGNGYSDYLSWDGSSWVSGIGDKFGQGIEQPGIPGSIHLGYNAGRTGQNDVSVALGYYAGGYLQGTASIGIGLSSGFVIQGENCIALGSYAGVAGQHNYGIAIGYEAGYNSQGTGSIAIGKDTGKIIQGIDAIAIGNYAGNFMQGTGAIAMGNNAGNYLQGENSICIGNYSNSTSRNSIVINASNANLNAAQENALYVSPIRSINSYSTNATGLMVYDQTVNEITYNPDKTFIIDHPLNSNKYLVHVCLEGPEAGVYYRGTSEITNKYKEIILPEYVDSLATEFTANATPVVELENDVSPVLTVTKVNKGRFYVKSNIPCEFNWIVYGKRHSITAEIEKNKVNIAGDGPYRYIK